MSDTDNTTTISPTMSPKTTTVSSTMSPKTTTISPTMSPKTTTTTTVSFSIWPPSQRTRDAVTNRLIETLSKPSVLSKRYGTLSPSDAATAAKLIEDESFAAASESRSVGDEDGIEVLQFYSKEISKRMLDTVKSKAAADNNDGLKGNDDDVPVASEEVLAVED